MSTFKNIYNKNLVGKTMNGLQGISRLGIRKEWMHLLYDIKKQGATEVMVCAENEADLNCLCYYFSLCPLQFRSRTAAQPILLSLLFLLLWPLCQISKEVLTLELSCLSLDQKEARGKSALA